MTPPSPSILSLENDDIVEDTVAKSSKIKPVFTFPKKPKNPFIDDEESPIKPKLSNKAKSLFHPKSTIKVESSVIAKDPILERLERLDLMAMKKENIIEAQSLIIKYLKVRKDNADFEGY